MDVLKIKIDNLINKRQLAIHMLSIVMAGVIGLILLPFNIKNTILTLLGIYYIVLLSANYVKLNKKVDEIIYNMEQEK